MPEKFIKFRCDHALVIRLDFVGGHVVGDTASLTTRLIVFNNQIASYFALKKKAKFIKNHLNNNYYRKLSPALQTKIKTTV